MKFTIIIPSYNSSQHIRIPLDSLEKQTFKEEIQVLIIDDGSTDNLKEVIKEYLKRNKTWEYHKKKNGNWGSVINYTKEHIHIKGEYVTILDSDDYYENDMLEEVSKIEAEIITTKIQMKNNEKYKNMPVYFVSNGFVPKWKAYTPISLPHGKFYKRELFLISPTLEENISYQDTVLYLSLVKKSQSIFYINKPLAVWWQDRQGNSTQAIWDESRYFKWIQTCKNVLKATREDENAIGWVLMYLWELNRNYKGEPYIKIDLDISRAKLDYIPFGLRWIAKKYFYLKTKKFINKI